MVDADRISRTAIAFLLIGGLAVAIATPAFAQDEPGTTDSGTVANPAAIVSGVPGAPGVPDLATNPGVLDGGPIAPPEALPDSPSAPGLTTATEIYGGSSGAPGTGAGSDAVSASGGE
jgi:hypothetical protein